MCVAQLDDHSSTMFVRLAYAVVLLRNVVEATGCSSVHAETTCVSDERARFLKASHSHVASLIDIFTDVVNRAAQNE